MTKEAWEGLSGKEKWDCIVALRGPDIHNSQTIKYFTTGVIRSGMGKFMRVGGQISNLDFVVLPSSSTYQGSPKDGPALIPDLDHFCQHVQEAANILDIPTIQVPASLWREMTLTGYAQAMTLLIRFAADHEDFLPPKIAARLKKLGLSKSAYPGLIGGDE